MLNENLLTKFIKDQNLTLSNRPKNPRFFDQKVQCDVLEIISRCILNLSNDTDTTFTRKSLQTNIFTKELVREVFKKPETTDKSAANEYDKFFKQNLDFLSFYKILERTGAGGKFYKILKKEVLEFLSNSTRNALKFIIITNKEFIIQNKLYDIFELFFNKQNKKSYLELRDYFINFIYSNTNIKNKAEPTRIFTPFINPLSYERNLLGTEKGRISETEISFDALLYGKPNWRDLLSEKPRNKTRKEWLSQNLNQLDEEDKPYDSSEIISKRDIKKRHNGNSEYSGEKDAIETHHIFPKCDFPQFRHYKENLIRLTPNEHRVRAHPDGYTQRVDYKFQKELLISKLNSIQISIDKKDNFYDLNNFNEILEFVYKKEFKYSNIKDLKSAILNI